MSEERIYRSCTILCILMRYTAYFEGSSQSSENYSASFTFMQPLLDYTHARHLQAGMHSNNPPTLVVAEERVTSNNKFSVRGGHGVAMCALEKVCIKTGAFLIQAQGCRCWPTTNILIGGPILQSSSIQLLVQFFVLQDYLIPGS